MVQKQVYRKVGGVRNDPGSFWASGYMGYSEQWPILISQVGVGSSWLSARTVHGASCRDAASSCDCTASLGEGEIEGRKQLEATQLWVYVLLPSLLSLRLLIVIPIRHLKNSVRKFIEWVSSLAKKIPVKFSSQLWNLEFITIYVFPHYSPKKLPIILIF